MNCGTNQLPCFEYVCYVCHDDRDVEEIIDFYTKDSGVLMENVERGEVAAEALTDDFFANCFYKIRNQGKL